MATLQEQGRPGSCPVEVNFLEWVAEAVLCFSTQVPDPLMALLNMPASSSRITDAMVQTAPAPFTTTWFHAYLTGVTETSRRGDNNSLGAAGGDRTHDPWLRRPILYPLSYSRMSSFYKLELSHAAHGADQIARPDWL